MMTIKPPEKSKAGQIPQNGSFADRLQEIVTQFPSKAALARAAEVPPSSLESYLAGVEPTRQVLVNLANAADVSLEWLARGRRGKKSRPIIPDGYAEIPFYDVRSAGGYVYPLINEQVADFLLLKLEWFSYPGMRPSALFVVEATESLASRVEEGDRVVVDNSWRTKFTHRYAKVPKGIYLVSFQAKLSVRQILGTSRAGVELFRQNSAHEVLRLGEQGFTVHGRVLWSGRLLLPSARIQR